MVTLVAKSPDPTRRAPRDSPNRSVRDTPEILGSLEGIVAHKTYIPEVLRREAIYRVSEHFRNILGLAQG